MSNWFKEAQAAGLDLNQPIQSLDDAPANPQQQQQPQQQRQVPETYEEIVQMAPQVGQIVEWLKAIKEASKYVQPAERRLEETLESLGVPRIGEIPELMQLFRDN